MIRMGAGKGKSRRVATTTQTKTKGYREVMRNPADAHTLGRIAGSAEKYRQNPGHTGLCSALGEDLAYGWSVNISEEVLCKAAAVNVRELRELIADYYEALGKEKEFDANNPDY